MLAGHARALLSWRRDDASHTATSSSTEIVGRYDSASDMSRRTRSRNPPDRAIPTSRQFPIRPGQANHSGDGKSDYRNRYTMGATRRGKRPGRSRRHVSHNGHELSPTHDHG